MLGGVFIPCPYSCLADSDGDVLLHALVDAMLGSAGLGDIGEHFPKSAITPGESSRRFVEETLEMLGKTGLLIGNVDCVIDLEKVSLKAWKTSIRESMARMLGMEMQCVNVKAKTAEGLGPIGEGRAVAAQVVVLTFAGSSGSPGERL
jgi:2-C-methyl-D-erythritol 2,4-cyclodiphosphate synthase